MLRTIYSALHPAVLHFISLVCSIISVKCLFCHMLTLYVLNSYLQWALSGKPNMLNYHYKTYETYFSVLDLGMEEGKTRKRTVKWYFL
jgi:hypothetical protein